MTDAAAIAAAHVRSWQVAYQDILSAEFLDTLDVERRSGFWRRMLGEGTHVLVADVNGVVGFCHPAPASDQGWGEIVAIYLHPDHWGQGLGRLLIEAGESHLASLGFERALLWVLEGNSQARSFYESGGWELTKRFQLLEIGGDSITEVRYEKRLSRDV